MPFIKEIVSTINDHLKTNVLKTKQFQTGLYAGLAILSNKEIGANKFKTFPVMEVDGGKYEYVGPDDKYPIIIYHKSKNATYTKLKEADNSSFGDDEDLKQTIQMQMVLFGIRPRLGNITAEDLESTIIANFPNSFVVNNKETITTPVSSVLDKKTVFDNEFKNVDLFLREDHIFISINYTIESQFQKGCFNICDVLI